MSKRRKPVIPDFSRKPKPNAFKTDAPLPAPPPVVSVNVKPQATSSKSGRRGS
jgi:hypothetical protein